MQNRELLEAHKKEKHGMSKKMTCKFWANGKCIDGDECLFSHERLIHKTHKNNLQEKTQNKSYQIPSQEYCKQGIKCSRKCGIKEAGHKKIKDIPCRFNQKCSRSNCHFKHIEGKALGFQKDKLKDQRS